MFCLLLESCTERSFIVFFENGKVLYRIDMPFGLHNSQNFIPKMEEGFSLIGKKPQQLGWIAVGTGPGSYTGIRVGAAVGKALSYANEVPLIGLGTLEGFIPESDRSYAAVIDAKMSGAYILKGIKKHGKISYISKPEICSVEDFEKKIDEIDFFVGPSLELFKNKIQNRFPSCRYQWIETTPDPLHLYSLAQNKFEAKDFSMDGSLELQYLR